MKRRYEKEVSLESIEADWERALTLPLRERHKLFRAIGDDLCTAIRTQLHSAANLETYIKMLSEILRQNSYSLDRVKLQTALASAQGKRCAVLFGREPEIIIKGKKTINTEVASFLIADSTENDIYLGLSDSESLELINRGKFLRFNTGADGRYVVNIVLVNVSEPILPSKEMCKLDGAMDAAILQCQTGKMSVFADKNAAVAIDVEPGNYKVCTYFRNKASEVFYVVLARTDEVPSNSLTGLSCAF